MPACVRPVGYIRREWDPETRALVPVMTPSAVTRISPNSDPPPN